MSCARCGCGIYKTEEFISLNKVWHKYCFTCYQCSKRLDKDCAKIFQGELFCEICYANVIEKLFEVISTPSFGKPCKVASTPSCAVTNSPCFDENTKNCETQVKNCGPCGRKQDCCFPEQTLNECVQRSVQSCSCIPSQNGPKDEYCFVFPMPREVANYYNRAHMKNKACKQSMWNIGYVYIPERDKCVPVFLYNPISTPSSSGQEGMISSEERDPITCAPPQGVTTCSCRRPCSPVPKVRILKNQCCCNSTPRCRCPSPQRSCNSSSPCPVVFKKGYVCCPPQKPSYCDSCMPPSSCGNCKSPPPCQRCSCQKKPQPCKKCVPQNACFSAQSKCPPPQCYVLPPRCPPQRCGSPQRYSPSQCCAQKIERCFCSKCEPPPPAENSKSCCSRYCCQNSPKYCICGSPNPCNCKMSQIKAQCTVCCIRCGQKVYAAEKILVSSGAYHTSCFTCYCCKKCLDVKNVFEGCGEIYCKQCYNHFFGVEYYGFGGKNC